MDFESREFWLEREDETVLPAVRLQGGAVVRAQEGAPGAGCGTVVPVILSGGCGSRLWPYSTEETPKQFLSFTGAKSLFQMTLERVRDRNRFAAPIIVGNLRHASLCERELGAADEGATLLLERCARNTAPAIAMAALAVRESHGDDALLLVMPSDHVIQDVESFHSAVEIGEAAARAGRLVTFGIEPTAPETGFGYIELGDELPGEARVRTALRFVEKPPADIAEKMVAGGRHVWNAGIFLFRAGTFLEEVKTHAVAIADATSRAVAAAERNGNHLIPELTALSECPSESVDYAVMEHSSRVAVVPMSPGWSDLGSWDALAELVEAPQGLGPITALDCNDCYIRSDGLQVAALGVRDLIIVASGQRLLILPRGRSQEVKKLLSAMDTIAA
jgi:mannose-1-phosphate guanylyltransferase/mannose-1-phosphate guanylyltransferase/mannose-6-phosphate isomerase